MVLRDIGLFVSHHWKLVLACWGLAVCVCAGTAPAWNEVAQDGEFSFLPEDVPSRVGETEFREAFSHDLLGSTAVIVARRVGRKEGLLPQDREFVETVLKPALERIANLEQSSAEGGTVQETDGPSPAPLIRAVRTANDRVVGRLLTSSDNKTMLVLIEFTTGFLNRANRGLLEQIETLIAQEGELVGEPENLFAKKLIPPGLTLSLSGPATVGRDLQRNAESSTHTILQWALLAAITGLLIYYRAPLLASIPMLSAATAVGMTMAVLSHLASWGWIGLFAGLENYLLVVLSSLAIFSSLVFVSQVSQLRFQYPTLEEAVSDAARSTRPVLVGGWAITLAGWGVLLFANFGKSQQLGWALVIGSGFVLLTSLSLVPALLLLLGRWAFWPHLRTERISANQEHWSTSRDPWSHLTAQSQSSGLWQTATRRFGLRPPVILIVGILMLAPLILMGAAHHDDLNYGLLSQLPPQTASVKGARAVQEQFPSGTTGPVTLIIEEDRLHFSTVEGKRVIRELSDALESEKEKFAIAEIRSVAYPLGLDQKLVGTRSFFQRALRHRKAVEYYVGDQQPKFHHATKLEIVFHADPFSRHGDNPFETLREALPELLPPELAEANWYLIGAPASIRDLETVTDRDQWLIYTVGLAGIFFVLALLTRRFTLSAVCVVLAGMNCLAALGATFFVFWVFDSSEGTRLDWQVPTLLFIGLVSLEAQGFWVVLSRFYEARKPTANNRDSRRSTRRTGGDLTGSGLIVVAIYAALLGSSLVSLKQLGFALAFGFLLDTILIRPLLLPACLVLLNRETPPPEDTQKGAQFASRDTSTKKPLPLTVPHKSDA